MLVEHKILKQDECGRTATEKKIAYDQHDVSGLFQLLVWINGYEAASGGKTVPGKWSLHAIYKLL